MSSLTGPLAEGLLAGYGVAVPVGAIGVLLIGLTARTSFRVGASAALGVATADGLYCLAAALGGTAAKRLIEPVAGPMRWTAAVVLTAWAVRTAYVAVRAYGAASSGEPAPGGSPAGDGERLGTPGRAYGALLALTLLNPATIVYFGALVLGRQAGDGTGAPGEAVFVAAAFVASASWQLLVAGGGSLVGRLLTGARGRLATALVSSAVIVVLAAGLLLDP